VAAKSANINKLISAVKERRLKEVDLFGEKVKVKIVAPEEAAAIIVGMQRDANERRSKAKESGESSLQEVEDIVDGYLLDIMSRTITHNIVEPELDDDARQALCDALKQVPLSDIAIVAEIFNAVLGNTQSLAETADTSQAVADTFRVASEDNSGTDS